MKRDCVFIRIIHNHRIIGVTKEVYESELDEEILEEDEPSSKEIKLKELRGIGGRYGDHLWLILI